MAAAVATVEEFVPDDGDDAASGQRQELLKRYATVRPFLPMLSAVVPMAPPRIWAGRCSLRCRVWRICWAGNGCTAATSSTLL